jgi:aminoglycoside 6'-N-acetyltransferase
MEKEYKFEPLKIKDFELIFKWRNTKQVFKWWRPIPKSLEEIKKEYLKKIKSKIIFPYIVYLQDMAIGYIQAYYASEVGGDWWTNQPDGTYGIDTFIGENEFLSKGHGPAFIKQLTDKLFKERGAKKIITDPSPKNLQAIRAYKKVGFKRKSIINTPDGKAILMELYNFRG